MNAGAPNSFRTCLPSLLAATIAFLAATIHASQSDPITSILAVPNTLQLQPGATHRILVTGETAAHWEIDLTSLSEFSSSHPDIASVKDGIVTAHSPGQATIRIRSEDRTTPIRVTVLPPPDSQQLSFVNDILPVLSKSGCNAGACHARKEGQNGFKLSVFAYDPKADYQEIVRESRGRRVFPASPPQSLLLKKPTMAVEHEGGRRLEEDSQAYKTLLNWIQQGMPYGTDATPNLTQITCSPPERRYHKNTTQPLLIQAHYSDGSIRDVTSLTEYNSNDKDIAQVNHHGTVNVGSVQGETVIVARYMGLVATSRITVPADRLLAESLYTDLPINNPIDEHAYNRFKTLGLLPSDTCSDGEFLRRASLDAIGRLPTVKETEEFLQDDSPDKRRRAISRILSDQAYPHIWAIRWGDLIRPNPSRVGVKPVYLLDLWLRDAFRRNVPYDQMVAELLTAQGSTHDHGPAALFRDHRKPSDAGAFVSRIFLGVRMDCAQCHHHPSEKWSQDDYYQLAAFFSAVNRKGQGISAPISGLPEFIYHGKSRPVKHPVTGAVMKPKPLDAPAPEIADDADPRGILVNWIRDPKNPFFARAIVNRVWSHFMGHGIVDPVDDFRASNPPTNKPLLDWLTQDFIEHRYDLKHLMRTIMESHLYQLSSLPNHTNLTDTRNYSRSYRRRISAEILLDAVSDLTETTETFQGMPPGTRACETWNNKLGSQFLDAFGRPNASAECPCERDRQSSVVQALHLMNSNRLHEKITHKKGRAARLASSGKPPNNIITELYLAAYSRLPDKEEMKIASGVFQAADASRQSATEDILWALINSAEFVFNH